MTSEDIIQERKPRPVLILLTPEGSLAERINREAFVHFLGAIERTIREFESQELRSVGINLQLACALLPDGGKVVEIQLRPAETRWDGIRCLEQAVRDLAAPPVAVGPVAFASQTVLWGGARAEDAGFAFPFTERFAGRSGLLDDLLMSRAASSETPQSEGGFMFGRANLRQSWWRRFASWIRQRVGLSPSGSSSGAAEPTENAESPAKAAPQTL